MSINLDNESANTLLATTNAIAAPDAFGGFYTSDRFLRAPVRHDMLYLGTRWIALDGRGKLAIAYHEACHCYRECTRFVAYSEASVAFQQGAIIRRFTQYHDDDRGGHDAQWFALLSGAAKRIQMRYPKYLPSVRDVIEMALAGDRFDEPFEGVDWAALDRIE